uniref:Uncharacterized protein n=1 Tax=Octopus bimaculoides TaxID=37653 RepID=A0A0L8GT52_OCTBM
MNGDCIHGINTSISKATPSFIMLNWIWKSSILGKSIEIRFYKSNIVSVLFYGSECWKTTKSIEKKLEVFQNKCLRKILKVCWSNMMSNSQLHTEATVKTNKKGYWSKEIEMAGGSSLSLGSHCNGFHKLKEVDNQRKRSGEQ